MLLWYLDEVGALSDETFGDILHTKYHVSSTKTFLQVLSQNSSPLLPTIADIVAISLFSSWLWSILHS